MNLEQAADEIEAVIKKHDLGGLIILANPQRTVFRHLLDPSWSCAKVGDNGLHIRSKRVDYATEEEQRRTLAATISLIEGTRFVAEQQAKNLNHVLGMLAEHVDYSHVNVPESPGGLPATIAKDLASLVSAESETTQGEWRVRHCEEDLFVERPKQAGEAYGVEILGDENYDTKKGDAAFIVAAKAFVRKIKNSFC